MKMQTIFGIFIFFLLKKKIMLNWVEYEKRFITSGPEINGMGRSQKKYLQPYALREDSSQPAFAQSDQNSHFVYLG